MSIFLSYLQRVLPLPHEEPGLGSGKEKEEADRGLSPFRPQVSGDPLHCEEPLETFPLG